VCVSSFFFFGGGGVIISLVNNNLLLPSVRDLVVTWKFLPHWQPAIEQKCLAKTFVCKMFVSCSLDCAFIVYFPSTYGCALLLCGFFRPTNAFNKGGSYENLRNLKINQAPLVCSRPSAWVRSTNWTWYIRDSAECMINMMIIQFHSKMHCPYNTKLSWRKQQELADIWV
jgi:hypothetical protein